MPVTSCWRKYASIADAGLGRQKGERIDARERGLPEAGIQGGGRTFIIAAVGGSCRMNPRTPLSMA